MDTIDRRLLMALQRDCKKNIADLAQEVGLSPSACHRRIGLLEQSSTIAGYRAELNPDALGYRIEFQVEITLTSQTQKSLSEFEEAVNRVVEVLECSLMTGTADYTLKIVAQDTADFERIHRDQIGLLPHVGRIESRLKLRTTKVWRGYPVPPA